MRPWGYLRACAFIEKLPGDRKKAQHKSKAQPSLIIHWQRNLCFLWIQHKSCDWHLEKTCYIQQLSSNVPPQSCSNKTCIVCAWEHNKLVTLSNYLNGWWLLKWWGFLCWLHTSWKVNQDKSQSPTSKSPRFCAYRLKLWAKEVSRRDAEGWICVPHEDNKATKVHSLHFLVTSWMSEALLTGFWTKSHIPEQCEYSRAWLLALNGRRGSKTLSQQLSPYFPAYRSQLSKLLGGSSATNMQLDVGRCMSMKFGCTLFQQSSVLFSSSPSDMT